MIIFVLLGVVSSIFQLTIFREFAFSIAKNELSLVVAVGIWLIFCSLGSLVGKKKTFSQLFFLPLVFSLIFCLSVCAIHLIKSLAGLSYYEAASIGFVFLSSFGLIGFLSFFIGYSFAAFSRVYLAAHPHHTQKIPAQFFAYEAIGFFIGGIAFTFILSSYSNPFIFAFLPLLFILTPILKRRQKIFLTLTTIFLGVIFVFSFNLILKKEFRGADILMNKGSRYGPIILARKFGVESLYVNGSLAATSEDKLWNEDFIHISLSARKGLENVLFIGHCSSGQIEEILKHNIVRLDCLDMNPTLSRLSILKVSPEKSKRINFIVDDPRVYIKDNDKRYDCIIMDISAPANLALNRYFSFEFFGFIKKRLAEGGIFCFHIPSKRDILSPRILKFNSCIINTVDEVFKNRLLIPSDSMIIIASDTSPIRPEDLMANFSSANIKTDYLTPYHLRDYLDSSRKKYIESMLDERTEINRDFNLKGFLYYLLLEQAKFYPNLSIDISGVRFAVSVIFIAIAFLISFLSLLKRRAAFLLNAGVVGFSSIGVTAVIFVLFQVYSGALFWKMGILMGIFMVGLGAGAFLINSVIEKFSFQRRALVYYYLAWVFFIFSLFIGVKAGMSFFYPDFILYGCSLLSGALTGAAYPLFSKFMLDSKIYLKNVAVPIYAADLAGAFFGTLVFSVFLIPFLGVSFSLSMLILLMALFALCRGLP